MTETIVIEAAKPARQKAMRIQDAAAYCGLSIPEFEVLVYYDHRLPQPIVILGEPLWHRPDIDAALGNLFACAHVTRRRKLGLSKREA